MRCSISVRVLTQYGMLGLVIEMILLKNMEFIILALFGYMFNTYLGINENFSSGIGHLETLARDIIHSQ